MADGLSEECGPVVQNVIDEVFNLFVPMAHREWLSWGRDLLFSDLQEEIEQEVHEAEAKQQMEEEQVEIEKRHVEEEERRQVAVTVKAEKKLAAHRAALGKARRAAMLEFHAKTLFWEDLQKQNTELADEASAILKAEAREDEDEARYKEKEGEANLPVVVVGKQKAGELDMGREGEDEVEGKLETKRVKFTNSGLLEFEGPVRLFLGQSFYLLKHFGSAIIAQNLSRNWSVSSSREISNVSSALWNCKGVIGRGSQGEGFRRGKR
jgi:hypothetical protein